MTHQQPRDAYLSMRRFQTYFRDVIETAAWSAVHKPVPLTAHAHLITDIAAEPITAADASTREYRPVALGWTWGPKWASAWFKVSGGVPAEWKGLPVALRFSTDTEGQIWSVDFGATASGLDTPLQGLDVNRDAYYLTPSAAGGEPFSALIEAACNHPFGASSFEWDHAEMHHRWSSAEPGRFTRCELAVFEPLGWELRQHYAFALKLLEDLPLDSNRAQDLLAALRAATNQIDQTNVAASAPQALPFLKDVLARAAAGSTTQCFAVGHAHLDTAWLWPLRETKRKALRTFSNQLRNMERFPSYVFLASQTQHYAWVEQRAPKLFEQIKARVAEGRWETGGGMWIEPDVNCVSGESLARQMLHGERWWRSRFGDKGRQRFLYLPDTFGFGGNLPQIMRLGGLDTFITNKLHWWQHTTFPHTTFVWRGIDGTEVLGHNTPGQDYNATNTPKELRRGETLHRQKSAVPQSVPHASARGLPSETPQTPASNANPMLAHGARDGARPIWLQPFGYGDGGGGATDWSIRFAEFAKDCDGVPRVAFSTVTAFCDRLHAQHAAGADFPVWQGELDMEIHRGTLTSQAAVKRGNREAEDSLRLAEILSILSEPDASARDTARKSLDAAWKLTLLNQFHDILPGSSIGWVYDDARRDHAEVASTANALTTAALPALAGPTPRVFNPTSELFRGVVTVDGRPGFADAPALGTGEIQTSAAALAPVTIDSTAGIELANGVISAKFSASGVLISLRKTLGSDIVDSASAGADLALYEDRPIMWDAWDIDHYYPEKPLGPARWQPPVIVEQSPLRIVVEWTATVGVKSTVVRRAELTAGSPRLDLRHRVEWNESHALLRFEVDLPLGPWAQCTHGTHYGVMTRPTHRNTAHERARFEFPAHGWVDLSEPGRGVALMADCKYGFSCVQSARGHRLGVSLVRAPEWPDPKADRGTHEFTLALMPHDGDWRAAKVAHQAELLRRPPVVIPASPAVAAAPLRVFGWTTSGAARIQIDALKLAEDNADVILRFHEIHGGAGAVEFQWTLPIKSITPVDLLERPLAGAPAIDASGNSARIPLKPFQVVTLRISRP